MIRHLVHDFRVMPILIQIGFFVLLLGGSLDVLYHGAPSNWTSTLELIVGRDGYTAHLVTFLGMIVTMAGVFTARRFTKTN